MKKAELQIAVGATCHCLIFAVDHLGEIFELMEKKSTLAKTKLHRTKYSGLIKNVIGSAMKSELISEFNGKKYGLIIDE